MEDRESIEYQWYLSGCDILGHVPLQAHEFWPRYRRYKRCSRILEKYARRSREADGVFKLQNRLLDRLINRVKDEHFKLTFLELAVLAGRNADGGDAGAPVRQIPRDPVLVGCGAKLHPDLDPEPYWRDP